MPALCPNGWFTAVGIYIGEGCASGLSSGIMDVVALNAES